MLTVVTNTTLWRNVLMYLHQAFNHLKCVWIILCHNLREQFPRSHAHCRGLTLESALDLFVYGYPDTTFAHCVIHNCTIAPRQRKSIHALMIRLHEM